MYSARRTSVPAYVRLVLALVVSWVALCQAAHASRPEELALPGWTGAVTTAGDVTTIDGRSAAITFGGAGVADYAGELEVKLVVLRGNPATFVLFPGEDGKSGFVRLELARGAGGASLGARRSDWDAAAGKWVVDRQQ